MGREAKLDLLTAARCLLFPIRWDEPFGMVMVEAMACGTPVVATRRGSVPEVVAHGQTGFVCDDHASLVAALGRVDRLSADRCRAEAVRRFDLDLMAARYEDVYCEAIARSRHAAVRLPTVRANVPARPRTASDLTLDVPAPLSPNPLVDGLPLRALRAPPGCLSQEWQQKLSSRALGQNLVP